MVQTSRRCFLRTMALSAAVLSAPPTVNLAAKGKGKRPNIVLFLVDDMGWLDSTPYGSRYYETPNIEPPFPHISFSFL